jgi:TolB protein
LRQVEAGNNFVLNPMVDEDTSDSVDTLDVEDNTETVASQNEGLIAFIDSGKTLYTIKPDGSEMTQMPILGDNVMYPQWSPDNTKILYDGTEEDGNATGMWFIDIDGSTSTFVKPSSHPAWSSDGQKIVYDKGSDGIYIYDIDTKMSDFLVKGYWHPAWSSDGQTIAFYERTNGASDIYLINPDGSDLRNLTNTPDIAEFSHNGSWSPDSRFFAFTTGEKYDDQPGSPYGAKGRLEIINVDTNERQKVTDVRFLGSVAWSPDGQRLVFPDNSDESEDLDLFIINVDGSGRQQITSGDGNFYMPTWGNITTNSSSLAFADILPPTPTPSPTPEPTATLPPPTRVPPTATPVPPCPNPGVQINEPAEGAIFVSRYIFIVGNANIANFHHYRIEYSTVKDGHTWNHLLENNYPVDNGKLMKLDASTVPYGPYGLRLTVVDSSGNYPEPCEVWFYNGY